jgi:hypothetical protein
MAARITPHFIQLTYEAALKSFWRKEALRKFLRECHVAEAHLSSWAHDESKRDFLDRTFAALQKSDRGKAVIHQMAVFLAEQTVFPDLRNWEDSAVKIAEASKAVSEMKAFLRKQSEEIRTEKEKAEVKARVREVKDQIQRAQTDLSKLSSRLDNLLQHIGTQQGGYDFQDWVYDFIGYAEIESRRPYVTAGRQIDGSITIDGTTYLVELKFTAGQAGAPDIDVFKSKVESKADNTMGIFLSMSGYSSVAVTEASGRRTVLLLLDASHLYFALTGGMRLSDIIRRLRRHAAQTGESFLAVNQFGGQ